MAGIDKIYGTREQYVEFKTWLEDNPVKIKCYEGFSWEGDKKTKFYEYVSPLECLYKWGNIIKSENIIPISNFPFEIDKWLWENCPIQFVRKRLKEQYGENGPG